LDIGGKMRFFNSTLSNSKTKNKEVDENTLRLIINIVADGCFEHGAIRWHLNKQRKIIHLRNLLDNLKLEYSCLKQKTGNTKIRLSVESSRKFIKIIGIVKKLPLWIKDLNKNQTEIILNEYSITDGCKNSSAKNSYQLTTSKEDEADILQELFIKKGYRAKKIKKNKGKNLANFILTVNTRGSISLTKKNIKKVKYSGKVWCVNVKNGTLIIRRNGKVSITLNSHRLGVYFHRNRGGEKFWVEGGCGCLLDQAYTTGVTNWQHGFVVLQFDSKGNCFPTAVPVIKHQMVWGDMLYK